MHAIAHFSIHFACPKCMKANVLCLHYHSYKLHHFHYNKKVSNMNVLQKRELGIILLLSPKDIFLKDVRPQHFAKSLFLTLRIDFQLLF